LQGRAETGRAETGRAETGRAETGRAETGRAETGRACKTEQINPEHGRCHSCINKYGR